MFSIQANYKATEFYDSILIANLADNLVRVTNACTMLYHNN